MSSEVKLTFLGTSDAIPSESRNHSSMMITYQGENILIDCGEGTQRQFRKAGLNPCKITKILITHWHGDHVLGLPGILQTLALSGYSRNLEIYGPKGTKNFMAKLLETFLFQNKFPMKIFELDKEGKFYENNDFYLETNWMTHGPPCNAYNFVIKEQVKIDKKKLKKFKLPQGIHLKNLKLGKDIEFNGKKYKAKDLIFKSPHKKISIVMDTSYNNKIVSFAKNADLLVIESSFASDLKDKAKEYGHMTSQQSAEGAKKAGVKKLVLTHVSQRYENNFNVILKEAKKVFKNVSIAKDFDVFEV